MSENEALEAASRMIDLARKRKELEEEIDKIKKESRKLGEVVREAIEQYEMDTKLKMDGGTVYQQTLITGSPINGDKGSLSRALETIAPELIRPGYDSRDLNAWVKEFPQDPETMERVIPEGLKEVLKVNEVTQIKVLLK